MNFKSLSTLSFRKSATAALILFLGLQVEAQWDTIPIPQKIQKYSGMNDVRIGAVAGDPSQMRPVMLLAGTGFMYKTKGAISPYLVLDLFSSEFILSQETLIRNISIDFATTNLINAAFLMTVDPERSPVIWLAPLAGGEIGFRARWGAMNLQNHWRPYISRGMGHAIGPGMNLNIGKVQIGASALWATDDFSEPIDTRELRYQLMLGLVWL